jgi:RNA polymerase sigma-70 factor (ECF subfamily)
MDPDVPLQAAATLPAWVVVHYDALYRYAYRLTGKQADAEDLTQQAFLVALRKRDQLRDESKALAWLRTLLRNEFLQIVRRPQARVAEDLSSVVDGAASHEEGLVQGEEHDRLQRALADMAPEFRVPLLMFHVEELSYREIAYELQVPAGTVMSRISRGRAVLRQVLGDETRAESGSRPIRPPAAGTASDPVLKLRTV